MKKINNISSLLVFVSLILCISTASSDSGLSSSNYYDRVCPEALPTIKRVVEDALAQERRMGASLLRLHFHDCFVNGCDASILLDQTPTIDSEKNAAPNADSARGFEVIDRIKLEVDKVCGKPVVSCADILTVAARDSVVALGGPSWNVKLGRKDSTTASRTAANVNIPSPLMDLPALIKNFEDQGLDEDDLVVLSGLLRSDQALFNGGETDELVSKFSESKKDFFKDFAKSMIKMGDIKPLTGNRGQIRCNCRKIN
ncbi:hypothetical protein E3N88_11575 [Mikania micrantha]|uniref:peroxidase n=1 Tax=Mikania micrantha TaxID=192012 RepID=A0A5N6PFU4_9ASTR|nr:hypothetical protein E3N88_11575 [Mikania micrantha]